MIAVHVGAGYHCSDRRSVYEETCNEACRRAIDMLKKGCSAVEAVTTAVSVLEDCPITNAGIGANLTLAGKIEFDAGIMDGASLNFASVGSLRHVKNPVKVAQKILEQQNQRFLSGGRIPPCTLVGKGALSWALSHGFEYIEEKDLVTKKAQQSFLKNVKLVDDEVLSAYKNSSFFLNSEDESTEIKEGLLDTVGAVCIDTNGNVSSAASSGGILLKYPGRLGPCCIFGTGFWAKNSLDSCKPSIACTVSGTGESLIKTLLAREWCEIMSKENDSLSALQDTFQSYFLNSPFLDSSGSKLAGILSVKYFKEDRSCDLAWVHNTKTMVLGYMSTKMRDPVPIISSQALGSQTEENIVGCEKRIKLSLKDKVKK